MGSRNNIPEVKDQLVQLENVGDITSQNLLMSDVLTYRLEEEIIYILGNANYSLNSLYELIGEVLQEAETLDKIFILYDARGVTAKYSNTEVRQFVSKIARHWPGRIDCMATVVSSDDSYNLARLGSLYARVKGCDAEYFRDIELAKQWIEEKINYLPSESNTYRTLY
jgi:hypothetical protein